MSVSHAQLCFNDRTLSSQGIRACSAQMGGRLDSLLLFRQSRASASKQHGKAALRGISRAAGHLSGSSVTDAWGHICE